MGSEIARGENIGYSMSIGPEATQLAGSTVLFTLLGVGSGIKINRSESGFMMHEPYSTSMVNAIVPVAEESPLGHTAATARPMPEHADIDALMGSYVPRGSTMARKRPERGQRNSLGKLNEDETVVVDVTSDRNLEEAIKRGAVIAETSGVGLMCGANALQISLAAMGDKKEATEIAGAIDAGINQKGRDIAKAAGVTMGPNDFTADQLAAGLQLLGDYHLVVIDENQSPAKVYPVGVDGRNRRTVYVHNQSGHWSGVNFNNGGRRMTAVRKDRR